MHGNSGLADTVDYDTAMNATLDRFVEIFPGVQIVGKDVEVTSWINEYMNTHPSQKGVCFYDCTAIMNQYKTWIHNLREIQPFYAMKCNPSNGMMNLMTSLPGGCFDCAGMDEIMACLSRGVSPNHIIFANPVKSEEAILFMREKGVWCGTVDSPEEIEKMHRLLGEDSSKCKCVLRLWVDDSHSIVALGSKFGCHPNEVDAILSAIKRCGMQAVGVAFHVGTGNEDPLAYDKAIKSAKDVFDKAKNYGFEMNLLDLGGGYSGKLGDASYENDELSNLHKIIFSSLEKEGFLTIPDFKIIAEPGRYFNNNVIYLACTVENHTVRNGTHIYRLNEGVFSMFKDTILCELLFHVVPIANKDTDLSVTYPSALVGPSHMKEFVSNRNSPVIGDIIKDNINLPLLKVGDHILFNDIGAYTLSLTTMPLRAHQDCVYFVRENSLSH